MTTQLFVGSEPRPDRLLPLENSGIKPRGGLWTCPYLGAPPYSEWIEWCINNKFCDTPLFESWLLEPRADVRILSFDTPDEWDRWLRLPYYSHDWRYIDFEALAQDYDGLHLSRAFIAGRRFAVTGLCMTVSAWDVDSTLWFRWCFESVSPLGVLSPENPR